MLGLAAVQASPRELEPWGEAAANPRTASAQALLWAEVMLRQLHFRRVGAQDLRKPLHLETQTTYGQNNIVALRRLLSLEPTRLRIKYALAGRLFKYIGIHIEKEKVQDLLLR